MHFGHTRCFLSALCYFFAHVVFVFAFACLHLRHQLCANIKDFQGRGKIRTVGDCIRQTPDEKPLRSCTLETQIMHFRHTHCFLSALCYSFARGVFVFGFACLPLRHQLCANSKQVEGRGRIRTVADCIRQTPGEKNPCNGALWRHRVCTLDKRAVSCLRFVTLSRAWFLSLPLPASTFATSSAQIENKFKDEEEFEQWLTAFRRHQVKTFAIVHFGDTDYALRTHALFLVCPLLLFRARGFCLRLCLPPPSPPALCK